jgi:hypothetical protein
MNRVCKKCGEEKPLEEFAGSKACAFGKRHICKKCQNAYHSARPGKQEYFKDYYLKNKDKILAQRKVEWDSNSRDNRYAITLNKYGWSPEDYAKQHKLQDGKCAICGEKPEPLADGRSGLVVDHDHVSGKVRKLLCHWCNLGLGKFKDNPENLRKAASYIEEHACL